MLNKIKFQEATSATTTNFDSKGIITLTVIRPCTSKNGRKYPPKTLKNAVEAKIFDSAKMFVEHDARNGVKEWVGILTHVHVENDGTVIGTGQIIDTAFKKKLELLNSAGKISQMGISISCVGTACEEEEDGKRVMVVEELTECNSVDFVARPAAGGRVEVLESEGAPKRMTEAEARAAVKRANALLGYNPIEKKEEDVLLECWVRLCNGDVEAAKCAMSNDLNRNGSGSRIKWRS